MDLYLASLVHQTCELTWPDLAGKRGGETKYCHLTDEMCLVDVFSQSEAVLHSALIWKLEKLKKKHQKSHIYKKIETPKKFLKKFSKSRL